MKIVNIGEKEYRLKLMSLRDLDNVQRMTKKMIAVASDEDTAQLISNLQHGIAWCEGDGAYDLTIENAITLLDEVVNYNDFLKGEKPPESDSTASCEEKGQTL